MQERKTFQRLAVVFDETFHEEKVLTKYAADLVIARCNKVCRSSQNAHMFWLFSPHTLSGGLHTKWVDV